MNVRRSVLIPIIELGVNGRAPEDSLGGRLLEVYSEPRLFGDDTEEAIRKNWEKVVAPLRPARLYQAGCVAVGAVRKLTLKKPKMAFYQWFKPQAWLEQQKLYAVYPEGPHEGQSAELGLALVLQMGASGSPFHQVIATGALDGQAQVLKDHDVKVLPVSHLVEKFRLVIRWVRQGQFPQNHKLLFFTPKFCKEENVAVEGLLEVQILRALGIEVVPIAWLSEAAQKLRATYARYLPRDHLFQWLVSATLLIALGWGGWLIWCNRDIPMAFCAPTVEKTSSCSPNPLNAGPFLVCPTGAGDDYVALPIEKKEMVSVVPVESILGWNVKIGQVNSFDTLLNRWFGYGGYYVAAIGLSEFGQEAKTFIPRNKERNGLVRILPGKNWLWKWELHNKTGFNKLILIAQRHKPIDSNKLQDALKQFKQVGTSPEEMGMNVMAATEFILSQFPNGVEFDFQMKKITSKCPS